MRKIFLALFIVGCSVSFGWAQVDTIFNPKSTEKIAYYEQLYRYQVTRVVDLMEKQNAGFKSAQSDIAVFILNSIKNGQLLAYDDSLKNVKTAAEILVSNTAVIEPEWVAAKSYFTNERCSFGGVNYESTRNDNKGHNPKEADWWQKAVEQTEYYQPSQIVALDIIEDVIFDKRRSRLYYDILSIAILAQKQGSDQMNPIAFINYKDLFKLVEKYSHSKNLKERDLIMWRNRYNPSENRTFNDAFKLRLFHGVIEKVENPDDRTMQQIYDSNGRTFAEAVFARWEEEMKMMEKEHNLWEY